MPKRRRRCSSCKMLKSDVKRMEDPFIRDVGNRIVIVDLCASCSQHKREDI